MALSVNLDRVFLYDHAQHPVGRVGQVEDVAELHIWVT